MTELDMDNLDVLIGKVVGDASAALGGLLTHIERIKGRIRMALT